MPVPSSPRVKLRTSDRRTRGGAMLEADAEPNMRLSRAILVMLLLHLVAVGGICAFSLIKERNPGHETPESAVEAEDSHVPSTAVVKPDPGLPRPNVHVVRPGETLTRIANESGVSLEALVAANGASTVTGGLHAGQELKLPTRPAEPPPKTSRPANDALALIEGSAADEDEPQAGRAAHMPPESAKTYTVEKGDTPARIAKKLKVSADALLKLNRVDDPKKLKPGQKLRIPASAKPAAKH